MTLSSEAEEADTLSSEAEEAEEVTEAPSSPGGFQVVADLQRLLSSFSLIYCSGLPGLLLLLLLLLSSLALLFLLFLSLTILVL